ncbi:MAG: CRISPR-associated endonuclease Cas2 [Bryobacterales bacterium]|nr:CRISPR-associated endonuclease Cas2 [Bryobacteraceae bacterium]MDW8354304.1 CRISPR-associated endonuclease Cas2 [Bryobacterales bacterium]
MTGFVPERSLWIAAYDVRDPKRLRLALQVLKAYSIGGQKSVFECFLTDGERGRLLAEAAAVLAPEDSFLMVRLDPRSRIFTLGIAVPPEDPPFFYVG